MNAKTLHMAYTEKFQRMADVAMFQVASVSPEQVNTLLAQGGVALDIRDKEEHDADHLLVALHVSRDKLEMYIEGLTPDLNTVVLYYSMPTTEALCRPILCVKWAMPMPDTLREA